MRIPLSWRLAIWFGKRSFQVVDDGRIYVARFRFSEDGRLEASWQVHLLPASAYHGLKKLIDGEREGAAESLAEFIEDPPWKVLTSGWMTIDPGDFADLAEKLEEVQDELKVCLLARPLEVAGSAAGLSDLSLLGVVAEHVPIPGIDKSFSEIRQYLEIAGIVLVALSGGHILVCASFKMLLHDQIGKLLSKVLERFLRDLFGRGKADAELLRSNTDGRFPNPVRANREGPDSNPRPPNTPPRPDGSSSRPGPDPSPPGGGGVPRQPVVVPRDTSLRPITPWVAPTRTPDRSSASIWQQYRTFCSRGAGNARSPRPESARTSDHNPDFERPSQRVRPVPPRPRVERARSGAAGGEVPDGQRVRPVPPRPRVERARSGAAGGEVPDGQRVRPVPPRPRVERARSGAAGGEVPDGQRVRPVPPRPRVERARADSPRTGLAASGGDISRISSHSRRGKMYPGEIPAAPRGRGNDPDGDAPGRPRFAAAGEGLEELYDRQGTAGLSVFRDEPDERALGRPRSFDPENRRSLGAERQTDASWRAERPGERDPAPYSIQRDTGYGRGGFSR